MNGAIRGAQALPLARLGAFAALALFVADRWASLLGDPPLARPLAATLALVGLATALAALGALAPPGRWRWPVAAVAALLGLALAAVILGVPARLLLPGGWDELASELRTGIDLAAGANYPYPGAGEGWARLTIMLGLALAIDAAAIIAFWPTAAAATARTIASLTILVGAYGTAATLVPPAAPLLQGLVLFALVAASLWLPLIARRNAAMGLGLIAVAGIAALPLCSRATDGAPLLDYDNWDLSSSPAGGSEFFTWNHAYGPLGWPRRGERLLVVHSREPHYWRTAVLDRFDGFRWLEPLDQAPPALELPWLSAGNASAAYLDPRWVHTARFSIDSLSSQLVVGAGTPLSVQGLGRTEASNGGFVRADGEGISDGDSYTVHYYSPQPTPAEMRKASMVSYRRAMRSYTTLALPRRFPGTLEAQNGSEVAVEAVTEPVTVPLRPANGGGGAAGGVDRRLLASPYAPVYRLARRLTARDSTTYDAVETIHRQLLGAYSYDENPPLRRFPLRAFLFRDRVGYCQQFSGAMALMLRMIGVPSRVASGFSPGSPEGGNRFVVRDFDAHSWVEVYFEGIGWVPFDPTPGTSPAASTSPGPTLPPVLRTRRPFSPIGGGGSAALDVPGKGSSSGGWLAFAVIGGLAAILAILGLGLVSRARRRRSLEGRELAEAQIEELRRALASIGRPIAAGLTLQRLERDSAALGRTELAAYAARLGAYRYSDRAGPPGALERRRMRRELGRRGGPWRALRALRAVPPLGPRPATGSGG